MKSAVSLYEFMPYGAPELIESRRRHLSRALVLASFASLVLWAATGGLALLIHVDAPAVERHVQVARPEQYVIPLTHFPSPPLEPRAPTTRPAPDFAERVPVPDDAVPADPPPVAGSGEGNHTGASTGAANGSGVVQATEGNPPADTDDPVEYVEELPSVVKEVKPDYPSMAREAGVEGLVLVRVLVGRNGRVIDVRLSEKQQIPLLNEAALAAARKWVFTPGLANGHPVTCWTAIPFRFRLH